MDRATPRFNLSIVLAALIVAVGLVAGALIVAHGPAAATTSASPLRPATSPRVSQASASEQYRAQVLAAPSMQTYIYKGIRYTLADVRVTSVSYDAKEDKMEVYSDWVWQPAMPKGGPDGAGTDFHADGYGHYAGDVLLNPEDYMENTDGPRITVTLR